MPESQKIFHILKLKRFFHLNFPNQIIKKIKLNPYFPGARVLPGLGVLLRKLEVLDTSARPEELAQLPN